MKKPDRFDEDDPLLEDGDLPPDAWRLPLAPEGFREDVLARTCAAVRGRCRKRRTLLVGAVTAAYAAGIVTAFVVPGGFPESASVVPVLTEAVQEDASPVTIREEPTTRSEVLRDPEQFALLLVRSPREKQVELLKAAGDRYLNEYGDVELALNYYRRLLSLEPSGEDAEPTLDDTWLLRSLKQARLQEEHHGNANS
ncbi:MAG: hypothetical protein R6V12_03345 [Candidatus Hydrogenedentota bacterium]